jgi:hypothetical protein
MEEMNMEKHLKKRFAASVLCLVLGLLTMYGPALAHGTEEHGKMVMGAQMMKLHAMMPMFSMASA